MSMPSPPLVTAPTVLESKPQTLRPGESATCEVKPQVVYRPDLLRLLVQPAGAPVVPTTLEWFEAQYWKYEDDRSKPPRGGQLLKRVWLPPQARVGLPRRPPGSVGYALDFIDQRAMSVGDRLVCTLRNDGPSEIVVAVAFEGLGVS